MAHHRTSKLRHRPIEDKLFWVLDDWGGAADLGELLTWAASDEHVPGKTTPPGPGVPMAVAETLARMEKLGLVRIETQEVMWDSRALILELAPSVAWDASSGRYILEDDRVHEVVVHLTDAAYNSYRAT